MRKLAKERLHPISPQLLAQHRLASAVCTINLKHSLRQIKADRGNSDMTVLLCSSSQTHLGTMIPPGRDHIITVRTASVRLRPNLKGHTDIVCELESFPIRMNRGIPKGGDF